MRSKSLMNFIFFFFKIGVYASAEINKQLYYHQEWAKDELLILRSVNMLALQMTVSPQPARTKTFATRAKTCFVMIVNSQ
jgi:hypothetical protein